VSPRRRPDEAGPKQAAPVAREPGLGVFGWGCARPAGQATAPIPT